MGAAATIATLPLVAFNFHQIPALGIPATVLALPAMPLILVLSLIAAVGSAIHPVLGEALGWVAWIPLEYLIEMVHLLSRVPKSTVSVADFNGLLVWGYYGVLFVLVLWLGRPSGVRANLGTLLARWRARSEGVQKYANTAPFPGIVTLALILALGVLAGLLWSEVARGEDGMLHVHVMDVGQGDSILIITPEGRQALVDGGPGSQDATRALGRHLSPRDRDLDLVVLTHPDEDHFRGLIGVLDRFDVDTVLEGEATSANPLYLEWQRGLAAEGAWEISAFQGQTIALGGSTFIEVLNPGPGSTGIFSSSNNAGVVLRLVHGRVSFLLTADIEAEAERRLLLDGADLSSTVLKVAHHGSRSSTTPGFLNAVGPRAAVISAGADNPYGHPHEEVVRRLEDALPEGVLFTTAGRGDVEFVSDGERLWVRTDR